MPSLRKAKGRLRKLGKLLEPARPVARNLLASPLTVLGFGCIDTGVFLANSIAGFIVTGFSLMLLEHVLADE